MRIIRQARGSEIGRNRQRIFLCCHPKNKTARDVIIGDLLSYDAGADCIVSFIETPEEVDETALLQELHETTTMVLIISPEFLEQSKTQKSSEFKIAKNIKLPIIPIALDPSLFPQFTEQEGAIHGLSLSDEEYRIKLRTQLLNLLVSESLVAEINGKAFSGRLFLSYRKKDISLAREFMKTFHDNKEFQSVAVWYDKFLNAGRVFDVEIESSIDSADVVTLMATKNITENGNYVLLREYPYAKNRKKHIVAVEFEELNKRDFNEKYKGIDTLVPLTDISAAFKKALPVRAFTATIDPERGFLLGAAFLKGIMVEKDADRAIELLTDSANGDNMRAAELLGKIYTDLLKYEDSIIWYKRAAEISKAETGEERPETARLYSTIASTYLEQDDHKSSLEWSLKALRVFENLPKRNNSDTAKTLVNTCASYQMLGELQKVPPMLEKAVKIYDNAVDIEITDIITGYIDIAVVYHNNISFAKAMETHLKAISLAEKSIGNEHPLTARTYARAALTYLRIGIRETALELLKKALDINRKVLSQEHPEIATCYELLSLVYGELNKYALVFDSLWKAKDIREKVFGKNHFATAVIYRALGDFYFATAEYEAAKNMLLSAFRTMRKSHGMNHPFTLGAYKSLRDVFEKLGIADSYDLYD